VTRSTTEAGELPSSATAATTRSRAPFKVGSSTFSPCGGPRAREYVQAVENAWRETEEIAGIADSLASRVEELLLVTT
jgi:hypothetical protein